MAADSYTYSLSIRMDRPIAECELQPHPFLTIKGGNLDNAARGKIMDANPQYFTYTWSRGPRHSSCANNDCPRGKSYDPILWTKHARGGPGLHCAICEKLHVPKIESAFCSINCFKSSWKVHSAQKHGSLTMNKMAQNKVDVQDDESPLIDTPVTNASDDDERCDWDVVCRDKNYIPTEADIGCLLRVEVSAYSVNENILLTGPISVTSEPVLCAPKAPPKRSLTMIPGALSAATPPIARFRIVSYNILSELYATKQAYPYCDTWSLNWPYRRKMIIEELNETQGDLICLQEVQADHFELHLKPVMAEMGYDGLFKQKSRESMGQYGKVDGCAVFWKRTKFILNESYTVDFNECAVRTAMAMGLDENDNRKYINRLSKDNIAQVLLLEVITSVARNPQSRTSRHLICLANTHLYSNHQRPDVKLWQTFALITEIERIVIQRDIPLILCGDFNSEPESAVYELMTQGSLESSHPELEESSDFRILPNIKNIVQSLELASMMAAPSGVEPNFTNYTSKFKGTLDYIFYSPARLRVLAVATIPIDRDIERECGEGLPSSCYPSDHVHLCCDVALMGNSSGSLTRHIARDNTGYMDNSRPPMSSSGKGPGRR